MRLLSRFVVQTQFVGAVCRNETYSIYITLQ